MGEVRDWRDPWWSRLYWGALDKLEAIVKFTHDLTRKSRDRRIQARKPKPSV